MSKGNSSRGSRKFSRLGLSRSTSSVKEIETISNYFKKPRSQSTVDDNCSLNISEEKELADSDTKFEDIPGFSGSSAFESSSTDFKDDFKSVKTECKWLLSKKEPKGLKKSKSSKEKKLKQTTLGKTIISDNFGENDVDSEELQLALALSKSTYDRELCVKDCDENGASCQEPYPSTQEKISTIKKTLEQFGFTSDKSKMEVANRRVNDPIKITTRRKKSKFKFITPTLLIRSQEEREAMIASKVSSILQKCSNSDPVQNESVDTNVTSPNLSQIQNFGETIFGINNSKNFGDKRLFYVKSLDIPQSESKCGCLLKDWAKIPGRDISPIRDFKKIIKKPSSCSPIMNEKESENRNSKFDRAISPDLFDSEDDDESCLLKYESLKNNDVATELEISHSGLSKGIEYFDLTERPDEEIEKTVISKEETLIEKNDGDIGTSLCDSDPSQFSKDERILLEEIDKELVNVYVTVEKSDCKDDNQKDNDISAPNEKSNPEVCALTFSDDEIHSKIEKNNSNMEIDLTQSDEEDQEEISNNTKTIVKSLTKKYSFQSDSENEENENQENNSIADDLLLKKIEPETPVFQNNDSQMEVEISVPSSSNDGIKSSFSSKNCANITETQIEKQLSNITDAKTKKAFRFKPIKSFSEAPKLKSDNFRRSKSFTSSSIVNKDNSIVEALYFGTEEASIHHRSEEDLPLEEDNLNVTDYLKNLLDKDRYSFDGQPQTFNQAEENSSDCLEDEELNYSSMPPEDLPDTNTGDIPEKVFDVEEEPVKEVVTTPSNKFFIKSTNVTPMPDYDSMNSPNIKKELQKFGLKPVKRNRGVDMLKYIYQSTHPFLGRNEVLEKTSEDEGRAVKKSRMECTGKSKKKLDLNSDFDNGKIPDGKIELISDIVSNIKDEDLIFERKQSVRVKSCRLPLQIAWHNFLSCNPEIKENILFYEPLHLEVIHSMLKNQGHKYHIEDLLKFFDKKCITVRTNQWKN